MKVPGGLQEMRLPIVSDADVRLARLAGRMLATRLRFRSSDATSVATAISELARNIVLHARRGEMTLTVVEEGSRCGLSITASDKGPGIPDVHLALQGGYSTCGGSGLGLSGARLLMDEFEIVSEAGKGTIITAAKWKA
jgi:serine/threonine-protein kinase RsbT